MLSPANSSTPSEFIPPLIATLFLPAITTPRNKWDDGGVTPTQFYFCWLATPICQHHPVYETHWLWLSLVYAVEIALGLLAKPGHWPGADPM
jgi:hypothetical protein